MGDSSIKAASDQSEYNTYHASCHCAAIRLSADVSPPLDEDHEVTVCNYWHVYLPASCVKFTKGRDQLKEYHYLRASHNFCPTCGTKMSIHLLDQDPNSKDAIVSLNARTFLNIDDEKIKIQYVTLMKDKPPVWHPDTLRQSPGEVAGKSDE